jgi:hypothetical protein
MKEGVKEDLIALIEGLALVAAGIAVIAWIVG